MQIHVTYYLLLNSNYLAKQLYSFYVTRCKSVLNMWKESTKRRTTSVLEKELHTKVGYMWLKLSNRCHISEISVIILTTMDTVFLELLNSKGENLCFAERPRSFIHFSQELPKTYESCSPPVPPESNRFKNCVRSVVNPKSRESIPLYRGRYRCHHKALWNVTSCFIPLCCAILKQKPSLSDGNGIDQFRYNKILP